MGSRAESGYALTLWARAGMLASALALVHETAWQLLGPDARVDASGVTYRTRWGLRRVCFADVVRAEFGVGGQVLFTTRDGASSHLDLGMVPVVDRDPALAHVRSRLPPGSCADITPPVHRKDQLLHVAWNLMLWLASVGVELGYSFRQWTG